MVVGADFSELAGVVQRLDVVRSDLGVCHVGSVVVGHGRLDSAFSAFVDRVSARLDAESEASESLAAQVAGIGAEFLGVDEEARGLFDRLCAEFLAVGRGL